MFVLRLYWAVAPHTIVRALVVCWFGCFDGTIELLSKAGATSAPVLGFSRLVAKHAVDLPHDLGSQQLRDLECFEVLLYLLHPRRTRDDC